MTWLSWTWCIIQQVVFAYTETMQDHEAVRFLGWFIIFPLPDSDFWGDLSSSPCQISFSESSPASFFSPCNLVKVPSISCNMLRAPGIQIPKKKRLQNVSIQIWIWINTYENTIFSGMDIHKSQLFWCELQGYREMFPSKYMVHWPTILADSWLSALGFARFQLQLDMLEHSLWGPRIPTCGVNLWICVNTQTGDRFSIVLPSYLILSSNPKKFPWQ